MAPITKLIFLVALFVISGTIYAKQCIKTKVGQACTEDHDCFEQNEMHLYCNKSFGVNKCAFHHETYIGHVAENVDCIGEEFSAEPWTNPIPGDLTEIGLDCMRMCLHIQSCFGISIAEHRCFLKNEKCFANLKERPATYLAVLNVVREDYKCGCHYPFTRKASDGTVLVWNPECPENQLTNNPYRCCSEKGLCVECNSQSTQVEDRVAALRKLLTRYAKLR